MRSISRLVACTVIVLIACECPAGTHASSVAGQYVGLWEFELRDSVMLSRPCLFVDPDHCSRPEHREYGTIRCVATLELRAGNSPRVVTGDLRLESCAAEYAGPSLDDLGEVPVLPPGLVTVAARTPLTGQVEWQPAHGLEVGYWRLGLLLRNSTGSIGELLGCGAESVAWQAHFLADVRVDTDPILMLGSLATTDRFAIPCGKELVFPAASLALERT
jgi:hypothetical protein